MINPNSFSFATRKYISIGFLIILFSFLSYLGVTTLNKSTKTLHKLDRVQGTIKSTRIIKHKYTTRRQVKLKNVLVLSLDGTSEEFGFAEDSDAYVRLYGFREVGKSADIYYDSTGKRIEEGVTLHIYDLKIGNYQVVDITEVKKRNSIFPIIFFSGAVIVLIITIAIIRSKEQTQLVDTTIWSDDD